MSEMQELLDLMAALRDPARGCPWDRAQTYASIVPHTIEEAYEVADAIERGDLNELRDELGDLLFQVVFYCRIAEEQGLFDFAQVAAGLVAKMVRRHPHVFGDAQSAGVEGQTAVWESIKAGERSSTGGGPLAGIPRALPALTRCAKLIKRGAAAGLPAPDADQAWAGARAALENWPASDRSAREHALGRALFALGALARASDIDPEQALRQENQRYEQLILTAAEPHSSPL
ncbi:MAG: nucleoside triphosphate pyrophosphohydrolase [Rhodocyclaceae bacterium]|nr:nucleoside triphosphate pyrophosphohydrolase [Rhodocyclaceae bacterium]MBX3670706.1 nucleoside triphosphate pyrophosphohydrolase [Rhodocyclaceae bacterium]